MAGAGGSTNGRGTRCMRVAGLSGLVACVGLWLWAVPAWATKPDPVHKVGICHQTASHTNPYVILNVDEASVNGNTGDDRGQGDHNAEHEGPVWYEGIEGEWGDIIPPFYDDGSPGSWPSRNWDAAGQAIFANGCEIPAEAGPSPTTPPPSETTPPGTETTPPGTEATPPGTETTPPGTETTPPWTETTPPSPPPSQSTSPPPTEASPPTVEPSPPTVEPTRTRGKTPPPAGATKVKPPSGPLAFTGPEAAAPLAGLSLSLLTIGSGLMWLGSRRRRDGADGT